VPSVELCHGHGGRCGRRSRHYDWLKEDPAYVARSSRLMMKATQALEDEAVQRTYDRPR